MKNEDTAYQNIWGMMKAIPRGNLIAESIYIYTIRESPINNLIIYLRVLEKQKTSQTQKQQIYLHITKT